MGHHEWHERADDWVEFAIAWITPVFFVVAPVVAWWRVAVIDDDLVGPRFCHLMTVKVRARQDDIEIAEVERTHGFDSHRGQEFVVFAHSGRQLL